ncbi:MAG TPA: hypothetical protein VNV86_08500 [Candidatus Acidoferrum sp.]|jgi:hypothetical protein|nr:hypothetical protein [Candidatus Acidoferrum sp.]
MADRDIKTMGPKRVNLILHGLMAAEMKGETWTVCVPMPGAAPDPPVHAIRYGNPTTPTGVKELPSATDYRLELEVTPGRPDPVIDDQFLRLKGSALDRQSGQMWAQIEVPKPDLVRGSRAVEMIKETITLPGSSTGAAISKRLRVLSDTLVFSYFGNFENAKFLGSQIGELALSAVEWNLCVYSQPPMPHGGPDHPFPDHTFLLNKMFRTRDGNPLTLKLGTQLNLDGASGWPSAGIDVREMLTLIELSKGDATNTQKSGDPGGCGQVLIES